MKAILMAGGHGTRLRPLLAPPINKHLISVGGKPLIHWPLELLGRSGVTEVLLLLNGQHPELIMETVGTGEQFGLNVLYKYTVETHGASVGKHLCLAKHWIGDEPFLLMLGDSVYFLETIPELDCATAPHTWAMPIDHSWDDAAKYALVPDNAGLMQTGLWLFDAQVFGAVTDLEQTTETIRIRTIVQWLVDRGHPLGSTALPHRSFIDCGTPEAIGRVNAITEQRMK